MKFCYKTPHRPPHTLPIWKYELELTRHISAETINFKRLCADVSNYGERETKTNKREANNQLQVGTDHFVSRDDNRSKLDVKLHTPPGPWESLEMKPDFAVVRDNDSPKPDAVTGNQEAVVGVLWPATWLWTKVQTRARLPLLLPTDSRWAGDKALTDLAYYWDLMSGDRQKTRP